MAVSEAALVTGCSSGIGRATARRLLDAGYPVYASARRPETLTDLERLGATAIHLDVTDESSARAAVDLVVEREGAVGVLVNNAGYGLQGPIEEVPLDSVRRQFETNVFGLVRLIQLALPGMREQGFGRIVNLSSMGGRLTLPGGGFYHASKYAVEAISDALRYEVRGFGVAVSVVEPGPVLTRFGDTAVGTIAAGRDGPYAAFTAGLAERIATFYAGGGSRGTCTPNDVADVVVRAVTSRHPRSRYPVGLTGRAMISLRRVLPDRGFDALLRTQFPSPP
jgi:NAD(P)-dependent dehydrogenase (short-subunit alcohol dehydrogenase family)